MKNPFEKSITSPPAENLKKERTPEMVELINAAKEKAEAILKEAIMEKQFSDRIEGERRAYTIFAALDALGEGDPSKQENLNLLIAKKTIVGFSAQESAEKYLKEVVGEAVAA